MNKCILKKEEKEQIAVAKEHVVAAANILKSLTPELGRVGWLLEDTLTYLDEALLPAARQGETASRGEEKDEVELANS